MDYKLKELEIRGRMQEHRDAITRLEKELWALTHDRDKNGV